MRYVRQRHSYLHSRIGVAEKGQCGISTVHVDQQIRSKVVGGGFRFRHQDVAEIALLGTPHEPHDDGSRR